MSFYVSQNRPPIYVINGMSNTAHGSTCTFSSSALCPDLLGYEQIGEADGLRGRVVRGFFWLLRAWPT